MATPAAPPAVSACREIALFDSPVRTITPPCAERASTTYFCASALPATLEVLGPRTDHTHTRLPAGAPAFGPAALNVPEKRCSAPPLVGLKPQVISSGLSAAPLPSMPAPDVQVSTPMLVCD